MADTYTPTPVPASDADCWPFACEDYHATYGHQSGEDPCGCGCHTPLAMDEADYTYPDR